MVRSFIRGNFAKILFLIMTLSILKKEIVDLYSTPIIQQTSFWSMVKKNQGVESSAFDSNARNRDLYSNVFQCFFI